MLNLESNTLSYIVYMRLLALMMYCERFSRK